MKNLLSLLYICDLESHTELPGYKICLKTIFFSSHIARISFSYHSHTSTPHFKPPTSTACLPSLTSLSLSRGRLVLYLEANHFVYRLLWCFIYIFYIFCIDFYSVSCIYSTYSEKTFVVFHPYILYILYRHQ